MEEIDRELEGKGKTYKPKVMRKEKRKVKRPRVNSYTDENGVHHGHVSSRWSETEVDIDQYGRVIEYNPDGTMKR